MELPATLCGQAKSSCRSSFVLQSASAHLGTDTHGLPAGWDYADPRPYSDPKLPAHQAEPLQQPDNHRHRHAQLSQVRAPPGGSAIKQPQPVYFYFIYFIIIIIICITFYAGLWPTTRQLFGKRFIMNRNSFDQPEEKGFTDVTSPKCQFVYNLPALSKRGFLTHQLPTPCQCLGLRLSVLPFCSLLRVAGFQFKGFCSANRFWEAPTAVGAGAAIISTNLAVLLRPGASTRTCRCPVSSARWAD